jgi:hypothetical protein
MVSVKTIHANKQTIHCTFAVLTLPQEDAMGFIIHMCMSVAESRALSSSKPASYK